MNTHHITGEAENTITFERCDFDLTLSDPVDFDHCKEAAADHCGCIMGCGADAIGFLTLKVEIDGVVYRERRDGTFTEEGL